MEAKNERIPREVWFEGKCITKCYRVMLFQGTLEDFAYQSMLRGRDVDEGVYYLRSLGSVICNDVHYYLWPLTNLLRMAQPLAGFAEQHKDELWSEWLSKKARDYC